MSSSKHIPAITRRKGNLPFSVGVKFDLCFALFFFATKSLYFLVYLGIETSIMESVMYDRKNVFNK